MTPIREEVWGSSACSMAKICKQIGFGAFRGGKKEGKQYHEAQLAPLVQEIAVDIDTIRLTQILRNKSSYAWQVLFFQCMLILNVSQFRR